MAERVDLQAELHGVGQVNAGFKSMGASSRQMGKDVHQAGRQMRDMVMMAPAIGRLASAFGGLSDEQSRTITEMTSLIGVVYYMSRGLRVLIDLNLKAAGAILAKKAAMVSATMATWGHVVAEKARAAAHAVAHALSGPIGWAIIAGAAGAAAAGLAISRQVPERHTGGSIPQTGLYKLEAGEQVLTRTQIRNIRNFYVTNNKQLPERHTGGTVPQSGAYNLLAGEQVLSRNQPNSHSRIGKVIINVRYGTVGHVVEALRKVGIK